MKKELDIRMNDTVYLHPIALLIARKLVKPITNQNGSLSHYECELGINNIMKRSWQQPQTVYSVRSEKSGIHLGLLDKDSCLYFYPISYIKKVVPRVRFSAKVVTILEEMGIHNQLVDAIEQEIKADKFSPSQRKAFLNYVEEEDRQESAIKGTFTWAASIEGHEFWKAKNKEFLEVYNSLT